MYTVRMEEEMEIIISGSIDQPIYEQIVRQFKEMILSKKIKENEMLPSIRKLAKELHISVITTQKAYEILLRDGFIVTIPGKGTYVSSQNKDFFIEENRLQIEKHLLNASSLAKSNGITLKELKETLGIIYEEDGNE